MTNLLLEWVIKTIVILLILVTAVAYVTLMERKVMAFIQMRVGPNRVGLGKFHLWGLMQPLADGLKMIFKEDIIPHQSNQWLYVLAPALSLIPALMTFIVIPYGSQITLFGRTITLHVTSMNVGLLYVLALTSVGVYGIVLAGWSSNNKYSLMGGLRSSAQMISYELSMSLAIMTGVFMAGSLNLREIVINQTGYWWHVIPRWYIFLQPLGFLIYMTAGVAETNRAPFDFPEAEQELVAGYHTEYSSMTFAMFFMAEYINMVTVSAVATNLFLGGWLGPFLPEWLGWMWFMVKVLLLLFFYVWMRWTLPRYRYDQLMEFGWKWLLPAAVLNLIATAALVIWLG